MRLRCAAILAVSFFGFTSAASVNLANATSAPLGCGANAGTQEQVAAREAGFQPLIKQSNSSFVTQAADVVQISVSWNVFYDQSNPSDGNYPDQSIIATIAYTNRVLAPLGLQLVVASVRRFATTSQILHGVAQGNNAERQIKSYRQGGPNVLNVYTAGYNPNIQYGAWATFPYDYASNPTNDGIVIGYAYLPGTDARYNGYNSGSILVHELGHWLGLYHTFQDGCSGNGDYVGDTPAEAISGQYQCLNGRDTCPDGGPDPVHNYMDYSSDVCYTQGFTPGQVERIRFFIGRFRGIII